MGNQKKRGETINKIIESMTKLDKKQGYFTLSQIESDLPDVTKQSINFHMYKTIRPRDIIREIERPSRYKGGKNEKCYGMVDTSQRVSEKVIRKRSERKTQRTIEKKITATPKEEIITPVFHDSEISEQNVGRILVNLFHSTQTENGKLKDQIDSLKDQIDDLQTESSELSKLRKRFDDLSSENARLKSQVENQTEIQRRRVQSLEDQISKMKSQLEKHERETSIEASKLKTNLSKISQNREESLSKLEEERNSLRDQVQRLNNMLTGAKMSAKERDDEITKLKSEISTIKMNSILNGNGGTQSKGIKLEDLGLITKS